MSPPKYSYRSGPGRNFPQNTKAGGFTSRNDGSGLASVLEDIFGSFSALGPAPRWWREPIPWYPDVAFGPYRKMELHGGYSRRELAFDGGIHALGVFLGRGGKQTI